MSEINKITSVNNNQIYNTNLGKTNTNSTEFSSYLGESKKLDDIFDRAANKYDVSVSLLKAIGKAESGFNDKAVSRCGAQGIMQLMPATAKSLGVTDSFDAEQNIMGGAKYISGLLKKYEGNSTLALAAYNAGSGNVAKYGGVPPFDETQNYVKKVTEFMIKAGGSGIAADNNQTETITPESYPSISYVGRPFQSSTDNEIVFNKEEDLTKLAAAFSYDDYLKFLDIFDKDEDESIESKDITNINAFKGIDNNIAVINMLKSQI